MPTAKKTKAGTWRIQLEVRGVREAGTFNTKREADEWAARRKTELLASMGDSRGPSLGDLRTLGDALREYAEKVSPTKKGWAKELVRINAHLRDSNLPISKPISKVRTADLVEWRDARLLHVKDGTVLREVSLLDNVFEVARRDWQWIKTNPMRDMRKPSEPAHRERVIAGWEIRAQLRAMGWSSKAPPHMFKLRVAWAFILTLQTGMRAGEMCALKPSDDCGAFLKVGTDKVNEYGREIPILPTTRRALDALAGFDDESILAVNASTLDSLFRKYRQEAELEGFTFHDARHTAATRLAHRMHILALCKMFGWTDPKRAMTYYNPTGKTLLALLMEG